VSAAVVVLPHIDRVVPLRSWLFGALGLAIAVTCGLLHQRRPAFRRFVRLTALGPLVLAGWFLLLGPSSSVVLPQGAVAEAHARSDANVLFVVFDEFPLAALLDGAGAINDRRFPGFGELSRRSTWYSRATTVAPWTNLAVPALLSGKMPVFPATASHYSHNVFAMLEPTHRLVPHEVVTNMCRGRACGRGSEIGQLFDDASILYLHTLLPNGPAARFLPSVEGRWANFRGRDDFEVAVGTQPGDSESRRFESLLAELEAGEDGRPHAWIAHFLLPHTPLRHLPGGDIYDTRSEVAGTDEGASGPGRYWGDDRAPVDVARQRTLLQARYVDSLVGRLMDALDEAGLAADTMMVVTSDHGVTFQPGNTRGAPYADVSAPDIMPVPLFVSYPGQKSGVVDDRHAQTIDVVPTIADVLDVDLPSSWRFDGRSLLGPRAQRDTAYFDGGPDPTPPRRIDPAPAVGRYLDLFGTWRGPHDTYAWGPYHELVGSKVGAVPGTSADWEAELLSDDLRSVDPDGAITPALVEIRSDRPAPAGWFAVTLNGTVAGLGRTYRASDRTLGLAMVDPAFLRRGNNDVGGFFIGPSGRRTPFSVTR
jgi:hypothetical protein